MALNWLGSSLPLGQCLLNSKCFFLNQSASYLVCSNKNCRSALDRLRDATILPIFRKLVSFQSVPLSPHFGPACGKLVVARLFRVHIIRSRYFLWATGEASPNCRIGELRDAKAFPPTCLTCQTNVRRKSKTGKVKILPPAIFPGKIVPFVMQKCFQGLFTFDWVLHRRMHSGDRLLQMMESARKSKHWSAVGLINERRNHIFHKQVFLNPEFKGLSPVWFV